MSMLLENNYLGELVTIKEVLSITKLVLSIVNIVFGVIAGVGISNNMC